MSAIFAVCYVHSPIHADCVGVPSCLHSSKWPKIRTLLPLFACGEALTFIINLLYPYVPIKISYTINILLAFLL